MIDEEPRLEPINYDDLDPGIRGVVRWMRERGWHTTDSGDGVTKFLDGAEPCCGGLQQPHVFSVVSKEGLANEADALRRALWRDHGIELVEFQSLEDAERVPYVEANYNPADGVAMVMLFNVCDSMLRSA